MQAKTWTGAIALALTSIVLGATTAQARFVEGYDVEGNAVTYEVNEVAEMFLPICMGIDEVANEAACACWLGAVEGRDVSLIQMATDLTEENDAAQGHMEDLAQCVLNNQ